MQQDRKIDGAFERFRSGADVAALGEVFDLASGTLFGVARHLVRDASEAEDLVQSTFLTAIEKAQTFDPDRPVLPWLLGILTLHARDLRRKRDRDPEVDRLHHPRNTAPTESAEHAELRGAVERAVASLPEIYRDVLGAHLTQGLRPEQIARRLDVAPGTVRVRLHRGLKRLRAALPAGFALGTAALLTPSGQAAMRARVLERAAEVASTWPAAGGAAAAGTSGALVPVVLGGAGVVALAGALALWSWSDRARDGASALDRGEPAPADLVVTPEPAAPDAGAAPPADPGRATVGAGPAAVEPGVWMVGTVSAPRGTSPAGAHVFVHDLALAAEPAFGEVGPDGRYAVLLDPLFAWTRGEPDDLTVRVDHPACVPAGAVVSVPDAVEVAPGRREVRADFRLTGSFGRVRGTVVPPPAPGEDLEVVLFPADLPPGKGAGDLVTRARVADDGAFDGIANSEGSWFVVALRSGWRPGWEIVEITPRARDAVVELACERGAALSGSVRLMDATPLEGARLVARAPVGADERRLKVGTRALILSPGRVELERQDAVLGPGGAFELTGLAAREHDLALELEGAFAARGLLRGAQQHLDEAVSAAAPSAGVDVVFPYRTGVLAVTTRGAALQSARVSPADFTWTHFHTDPTREELDRRQSVVDRTDTAGRYVVCAAVPERFGAAETGAVELEVHRVGFGRARVAWPRAELRDGAVRVVDLESGTASADLVLRLEGAPATDIVERFRIQTPGSRGQGAVSRLVTRDGDDLVLLDVEPGAQRLEVKPTMAGSRGWFGSYVCPFDVDVDVEPGQRHVRSVPVVQGGRLRLTFSGDMPEVRRLSARLYDSAGRPVRTGWFAVDPATNLRRSVKGPRADWVNQTWPNLPPAAYVLEVDTPGSSAPIVRRFALEPGRTTSVRIDLGG